MQRPRNETAPRQHRRTEEGENSTDADEDGSIWKIGLLHKGSTGCVWDFDIRDTDTG
jgi:hypothetical protein